MANTVLFNLPFIEKEAMIKRNYKLVSSERNGQYLKYESVFGALKRKGKRFEQLLGNGQRLIQINKEHYEDEIPSFHIGIKCDGGTRTIFSGTIETEEQLDMILKLVD